MFGTFGNSSTALQAEVHYTLTYTKTNTHAMRKMVSGSSRFAKQHLRTTPPRMRQTCNVRDCLVAFRTENTVPDGQYR